MSVWEEEVAVTLVVRSQSEWNGSNLDRSEIEIL